MLYQNTQSIFWNNESLEKPDLNLINTYYNTWNALGPMVAFDIDINTLTFNISSTNPNFNINLKWFKFVDNNNNTYYYILDSWSLHGTTYTITLSLDIWSTYIATYFNSANLEYSQKVYFQQKEISNSNLINQNVSNITYLSNIYQEHTNLSVIFTNYINNYQLRVDPNGNALSVNWGSNNVFANSSTQVIDYASYVYKVNLASTGENNIGMTNNLTFISFSKVASNESGLGWNNGYWNWWQLIKNTTDYDLDLVEMPFDMNYLASSPSSPIYTTNEYNWTANNAINSQSALDCYYGDYNGFLLNYNFFFFHNSNYGNNFTNFTNYTDQDCFNWFNNDLIPLKPNANSFQFTQDNIPTTFSNISLLEYLFPYLFNFRKFKFNYMFKEYAFNYSNFTTIYNYFNSSSYLYMFVPNYPSLLLNIFINQPNSLNSFSNLIASFNFMNANLTNTLSVSNDFLTKNKAIIQTSHAMVQNQSDLMWINQSLNSANIIQDIMHPFKTAESWTNTALNNQNLWRQYSLNYGKAKLTQLDQSNTLSSAGTNSGGISNLFMLTDSFLRDFDLKNVITYIDKYGYIYEKWDSLSEWYKKYYHNFVKITTGLEKLFNQTIPNALVPTCLEIMSNGVIIWSNLQGGEVAYLKIEEALTWLGSENITFTDFCENYYYNMEANNGNTN